MTIESFLLPLRARIAWRLLPGRFFVLSLLPKDSVCAEVGTYKGEFAASIVLATKPRKLHLIDPWKYEAGPAYQKAWYGGTAGGQGQMDGLYRSVQKRFRNDIAAGRVVLHRKSSDVAYADFPDAYFDWVYIDGNHLYDFVAKDLRLFYPKVKPGGFICGDDYGVGGWWENGVQRAVDEFAQHGFCDMIVAKEGQFILKKPLKSSALLPAST